MKMAEYLEFVSDLKYYMQCEMIENTQESDNYKFPVGTLVPFDNTHKSVNIYFNHYQSYEIAKQKWEERKQRIIWDKLYVIYDFNDKDCDTDLLYEFDKLPFKHKMSLTHYKKVDGLKDTYKLNCIGENEQIIKEFEYDTKTGKRLFEEWDYLSFLNTD